MSGLTARRRCLFAEQAQAQRQAVLAKQRQRAKQFARWIACRRRQNCGDVQAMLLSRLKAKVHEAAENQAKTDRTLMRFLDLPVFRKLRLRDEPVCENSTTGFVDLPDLPAFKGEPLDTRFLQLKG